MAHSSMYITDHVDAMTGVIVGLFHKLSSLQYLYTHVHDIYSHKLNANVWDIH